MKQFTTVREQVYSELVIDGIRQSLMFIRF